MSAFAENFARAHLPTALDAEVYGYRARLTRYRFLASPLWGAPWTSVARAAREPLSAHPSRYDMAVELLSFGAEMEQRYPVLLENPLAGLGA